MSVARNLLGFPSVSLPLKGRVMSLAGIDSDSALQSTLASPESPPKFAPELSAKEPRAPLPSVFKSFWMGGFESACHINKFYKRVDMIADTQHDVQAPSDFALLLKLQIETARDGIRWHLIETRPGYYDFSSFAPMLQAALTNGIQVLWNLCHYGWPEDIDPLSPFFVERFARFSKAIARYIREHTDEIPFYTPVNEMSFLSWAIGYKGIIHPVALGRGWDVKCQLARASIAAMEAIWDVDKRARFTHVDPVIHVVPPRDRPDMVEAARTQHEWQWHSWDLICGKLPEAGGHPKYLDIVGVNYYHSNQFEHPDVRLLWEVHPRDDRFVPFHYLLANVAARYQRPLYIAETSHLGVGRALWLHEIIEEVLTARLKGVPLEAVCLYPILDRPDWEDPNHWHNSGLVDLHPNSLGELQRVINPEYGSAFRQAQQLMAQYGCC